MEEHHNDAQKNDAPVTDTVSAENRRQRCRCKKRAPVRMRSSMGVTKAALLKLADRQECLELADLKESLERLSRRADELNEKYKQIRRSILDQPEK